MLSYIQIQLFKHNENVVFAGDKFEGIYMMAKNMKTKVIVISPCFGYNLAILKHGSFFGDASVVFDVPSKYTYKISYQRAYLKYYAKPIYICQIAKEHVIKIVDKYPRFGNFLRHRALRRLSYWEFIETGEAQIE